MALAYVRSASDVNQMADVAFFSRYGEASRAIGFFPQPASRWPRAFSIFTDAMRRPSVEFSSEQSHRMRLTSVEEACHRLASSSSSWASGLRPWTLGIPSVASQKSGHMRPVGKYG